MTHPIRALAVATAVAALVAPALHAAPPRDAGIVVHGSWTLTVRAHGRVVAKRQFENALTQPTGTETLAAIFARQEVPAKWGIVVLDSPGRRGICASGRPCLISEAGVASVDAPNLVVEGMSNEAGGSGKIRLRGSIAAVQDGQITNVATSMGVCATTGSFCRDPDTSSLFTSKRLSAPLQLQAGQQLAVSVVFSFS